MNIGAEGKVSAGRSAAQGLEPNQELSRPYYANTLAGLAIAGSGLAIQLFGI